MIKDFLLMRSRQKLLQIQKIKQQEKSVIPQLEYIETENEVMDDVDKCSNRDDEGCMSESYNDCDENYKDKRSIGDDDSCINETITNDEERNTNESDNYDDDNDNDSYTNGSDNNDDDSSMYDDR